MTSGAFYETQRMTREQIEALLEAHRAEYLRDCRELLHMATNDAQDALTDFERDALALGGAPPRT